MTLPNIDVVDLLALRRLPVVVAAFGRLRYVHTYMALQPLLDS